MNATGPMSQLPPQIWPATNVPIHPNETPEQPLPADVAERLWRDGLPVNRDGLLMLWQQAKDAIEAAKTDEMSLRKLCVSNLVPQAQEGTNNVELGNGYVAKAVVKFNYNLKAPEGVKDVVTAVDSVIDRFRTLDNEGPFIAERLFKWNVDVSVSEYRKLCEEAQTSATKAALLRELNTVLEIKEAAPTLEIKEPKVRK
jgi:hypothetical protein